MSSIVNNLFLTAQKHVSHDCQLWGDFALDIAVFMLDFVQCAVLNSSPVRRVVTYHEGFLPIKSKDTLIT